MQFITLNFDFTQEFSHILQTQIPVRTALYQPERELATYGAVAEEIFTGAFAVGNAFYLKNSLLRVCDLEQKRGAYWQALAGTELKNSLLTLLQHQPRGRAIPPLVEEIRSYMGTHYGQIPDNGAIAHRFGYHSYYLNQLFKTHTGQTLHQYLLEVRLAKAQELLRGRELTVSAVAEACGFVSPDHFARLFRTRFGITPTAYRKQAGQI